MVGREITDMFPKTECPIGEVVLKVEDPCAGRLVQHVSLELSEGRRSWVPAGLWGAGRTETMETDLRDAAQDVREDHQGRERAEIKSPKDAIENHISLLTEDRRGNGIVGLLSVRENMVMANLNLKAYGMPLNAKKMREDAQTYIDKIR